MEGQEAEETVALDEALGAVETAALKEGQEAEETVALDNALEADDAEEEAETQGRVDLVDNERPVEADEAEEDEAVDNKASDESCLDTRSAHRVQRRSQQPVLSNA